MLFIKYLHIDPIQRIRTFERVNTRKIKTIIKYKYYNMIIKVKKNLKKIINEDTLTNT
jgi:hypothetical protein